MTAVPGAQPTPLAPQPTPQPTQYVPRWGIQTGLVQTRQPAFWMFVVLLALAALVTLSEQLIYLQHYPQGWIVSVVLLAIYVAPLLIAIYVLDLFEREPVSLIIAAFVWGGVIATAVAITVNTSLIQVVGKLLGPAVAQAWAPALVAPPVEETLKYLGVVTIFLIARSEINDLFDGFLYGAIVGLGFAAVEHVQYFIVSIGQPGAGDQIGPVISTFILRAILFGGYMHVLWSGLAGIGLAYYVTRLDQPRSKRILVAAELFLLAILAHMVWNSPPLQDLAGFGGAVLYGLIKGLPFLIALIILVRLSQQQTHNWFRTFAAADIGTDVITEQEVADLRSLRSRWEARRRMAQRKGPQGGRLQGQLQKEQVSLGMIRSYTAGVDDPPVTTQREKIRSIRAQLDALPDIPQPVVVPYTAPVAAPMTPPAAPLTTPAAPVATPAAPVATPAAQPPAVQPPAAAAPTVWIPTHVVPAAGMAAWAAPDPSQPPIAQLAPGVQLVILEQQGAWARVMGSNSWTGWVDGRLLTPAA